MARGGDTSEEGGFDRVLGELCPGRPFEEVVGDHAAVLLCVARKLALRSGSDAEDLVQDTLERAWRSRGSFRAGAPERPWLLAILYNRAKELSRRRRSLSLVEQRWYSLAVDAGGLQTDEGETVRDLTALPLQERAALVLHLCGGLTASEVGTVLGCSTDAAHKRIQRARLRLISHLDRTGERRRNPFMALACREARRRLPAYLDGVLSPDQRTSLEEHVNGCPRCPMVVQAVVAALAQLAAAPGKGQGQQHASTAMVARLRAMAAADLEP